MAHAILRLPAVKARTGLSRSTIYLLMSRGEFVPKVRISTRAVGWNEAAVEEWIAERIERSRAAQSAV